MDSDADGFLHSRINNCPSAIVGPLSQNEFIFPGITEALLLSCDMMVGCHWMNPEVPLSFVKTNLPSTSKDSVQLGHTGPDDVPA